ncbi:MAG: hypothetical protein K0Q53_112 [Massilibacillus sp.]|nr:hypothetical protein [Massilibacillus sp.]
MSNECKRCNGTGLVQMVNAFGIRAKGLEICPVCNGKNADKIPTAKLPDINIGR